MNKLWSRAILFADMNAFFASVEQLDEPSLRGKPVAVTNGELGTCIITSSYEARAHGVKTGMRLKDAQQICPRLVQCPARPERYAQLATLISENLRDAISPDIEIFSVDEFFLDVTRCQRLLGHPQHIAKLAKQVIYDSSGLLCSVGISGDKTTAKYAGKQHKPDGLTVVPPWEAKATLHNVAVTELCGIGKGIGRFLAARGVYRCGDMQALPIGVLGKRFGNPGRRIWHMCQGQDPEKVHTTIAAPKSVGHGKVVPPNTININVLTTYLLHMAEKVSARLRHNNLHAQCYSVGLLTKLGWLNLDIRSATPHNDGKTLFQNAREIFSTQWQGEGVHQVHILARDPRPVNGQLELFSELSTPTDDKRNQAMDAVNLRYGEFTLTPARLLKRSSMPNVISPAWKPFGARQSI